MVNGRERSKREKKSRDKRVEKKEQKEKSKGRICENEPDFVPQN